jgi:hypothetical protein
LYNVKLQKSGAKISTVRHEILLRKKEKGAYGGGTKGLGNE